MIPPPPPESGLADLTSLAIDVADRRFDAMQPSFTTYPDALVTKEIEEIVDCLNSGRSLEAFERSDTLQTRYRGNRRRVVELLHGAAEIRIGHPSKGQRAVGLAGTILESATRSKRLPHTIHSAIGLLYLLVGDDYFRDGLMERAILSYISAYQIAAIIHASYEEATAARLSAALQRLGKTMPLARVRNFATHDGEVSISEIDRMGAQLMAGLPDALEVGVDMSAGNVHISRIHGRLLQPGGAGSDTFTPARWFVVSLGTGPPRNGAYYERGRKTTDVPIPGTGIWENDRCRTWGNRTRRRNCHDPAEHTPPRVRRAGGSRFAGESCLSAIERTV